MISVTILRRQSGIQHFTKFLRGPGCKSTCKSACLAVPNVRHLTSKSMIKSVPLLTGEKCGYVNCMLFSTQGNDDDSNITSEKADEESTSSEDSESSAPETEKTDYLGVTYDPSSIKKWAVTLSLNEETDIDGGHYWTAEDAARGYDELVRMYVGEKGEVNFEEEEAATEGTTMDSISDTWEIPDSDSNSKPMIPVIAGKYLTVDEVVKALEDEKATDVVAMDLEGKTDLANYMIFCTGRSRGHMRRMADMMIDSIVARHVVDDFDYEVEGRDCNDWMIADLNNIVVHFMKEETRRILNLEDHWENMRDNKHIEYAELSTDEVIERHGVSQFVCEDEDEEDTDEDIDWK